MPPIVKHNFRPSKTALKLVYFSFSIYFMAIVYYTFSMFAFLR